MNLDDIKGIGIKTKTLLNKININDIETLINYLPYRYEIIKRSDISSLEDNEPIIIDGILENIPALYRINKRLDKMTFRISTDTMLFNVIIYNRGFLKTSLKVGMNITVIGKYSLKNNTITASDIKLRSLGEKVFIEPIYHKVNGISDKQLNSYILDALDNYDVIDYIPLELQEKYHFIAKKKALNYLHRPNDLKYLNKALERSKYEELFIFMLKMQMLKNNKKTNLGLKRNLDINVLNKLKLPFELTNDQKKAVNIIFNDLNSEIAMNRLLQGDVGSGKTIVAFIAIYLNHLANYQSALMAPTEILAIQHYNNFTNLFDIKCALLTGKTTLKEKKKIYDDLKNGKISVIIGTHALISDNVIYNNLGLVITDEQHRFGVKQRENLYNKGITPDILYLSATPIPRTYAITLYGDMDISSIHTMPKGRKKVTTLLKTNKEIKDVLTIMYDELLKHHQIYVVAPLIEDNNSDMENVVKLEEKMNLAFGKKFKVGTLHGKMDNKVKEEVMQDFKKGLIDILISTTVIEVGVDVKNATTMVIFDSYRFGLSTLHQLRGRVGRNELDCYCILVSDHETARLKILTETNDGFKISEEDFKLRGSGDLFGIKQSGDMNFNVADIKKDYDILLRAKEDSEVFFKNGSLEENKEIKNLLALSSRIS